MRNFTILGAAVAMLGLATTSARADDDCRLVNSWYAAYFGRPADNEGMQNWVGWMRRGMTAVQVQARLLGSDEYYHRNGCTLQGFVAALYRDVLGRNACNQEVEQWVCQIGPCGGRTGLAERFLCASETELRQRTIPPVPPAEFPPPGFGARAFVEPAPPIVAARRVPVHSAAYGHGVEARFSNGRRW